MKYASLRKANLNHWLKHLKNKAKLYAPRKKENLFVFRPVKEAGDVCLEYIPTILPHKKYYFPQKEKLFKFSAEAFKTAKAIDKFEGMLFWSNDSGLKMIKTFQNPDTIKTYFKNLENILRILGFESILKYMWVLKDDMIKRGVLD